MDLDVRSLEPLAAPEEGEHRGGGEAQEPAAGRRVADHLPHEAEPPCPLVVGRAAGLQPPHHPRRHVVDEVLPHPGQLVHHFDPVLAEHRGPADAGELEKLGGVDRAPAEHHLAPRERLLLAAVAPVADSGAALAVEDEPVRERAARHVQVRPAARGAEIAMGGAHSPPPADGGLGLADPFLALPVVVRVVRQAGLDPGPEQRVVEGALVRHLAHPERAALRAPFVRPALEVLHALEHGQHVVVAPAPVAELGPGVVVEPLAADEDEAVDRARPAEHPPARDRDRPPARAFVGLGAVAPVGGRVVDELREADRHRAQPVALGPGFEQQHPPPAVLRQPVREHAARGPRPHHDEVVPVLRHYPVSRIRLLGRSVGRLVQARQTAVIPPSITSSAPVIHRDSSEAR